jgi:MoaA/NifB/PqqE/SkfB family radical SAM enzyme
MTISKSGNLLKSRSHPCFNGCGGKYARIHLPVAPLCNIRCNYCVRKYDCPNESRPGVCTAVLSPEEALERFKTVKSEVKNLSVAGIAGPGDGLANFDSVRKTLELVREAAGDDGGLIFCLSTNGLLLPRFAEDLAKLGVSHLTVTINAVDSNIGSLIYESVTLDGKTYTGEEGARVLLENQIEGLKKASDLGMVCKVNCVMLKGINDAHIPVLIEAVKEAGADMANIMQLIPVKGSVFESMPLLSNVEIRDMKKRCEGMLPQMYHCRQCRADAIGPLQMDVSYLYTDNNKTVSCTAQTNPAPGKNFFRFAVATRSGRLVDQHFGHAEAFSVYRLDGDRVTLEERRDVAQFCRGPGGCIDHDNKIGRIIGTIGDCDGVIALRIGDAPRALLEEKGIGVYTTYNLIEDAVREAAGRSLP